MLTQTLAPTLQQRSTLPSLLTSPGQILTQLIHKSGYPNRTDGRNWGHQWATVPHLLHFWGTLVIWWQMTVFENYITLTAPGLELKLYGNSSLMLVRWLQGQDTAPRDLPKVLSLGTVCEFLSESLMNESFLFICGDNYDPPPLAEINSRLQVDITMQGRGPTALFPDFLQYWNE